MDLVDIDKVLDDLELNEDKTYNAANRTKSTDNKKETIVQQQSGLAAASLINSPPSLPFGSQLPPSDGETNNNNHHNNSSSGSKSAKSKIFVNITNVFSSLHEYVNVDIERSIRAAEAVRNNPSSDDPIKSEIPPPCLIQDNKHYDVAGEDDEEDDCTEDLPDDFNGSGALISSDSSITTSSPSSFSSGPSPGSTSSDSTTGSFAPDAAAFNALTHDNDGKHAKQREHSNEDTVNEDRQIVYNVAGVKVLTIPEDNSCELGLSSISSCLYNENTSSSFPGLSTDLYKVNALSSISSSTPKDSEDDEKLSSRFHEIKELSTTKPIDVAVKCEDDDESRKQVNVVGFGSTMDEISDTELDSILQEIDSDLQIFGGIKIDDAEPGLEAVSTKQISDTAVNYCDSKAETEDAANADNFSQASTIEFAESRLQTDFAHETAFEYSANNRQPQLQNQPQSPSSPLQEAANPIVCDIDLTEISESNQDENQSPPKSIQQRPNSLDIPIQVTLNVNSNAGQTPPASMLDDESNAASNSSPDDISSQSFQNQIQSSEESISASTAAAVIATGHSKLGKIPPFWIPDSGAQVCMQCQVKFSLIKRRHHCRACGLVLCSTCCSQKAKLEFLGDNEVRVCVQCHLILKDRPNGSTGTQVSTSNDIIAGVAVNRSPNPNNPMEYCSVIPPHQQVSGTGGAANPISVLVPVGVLKREGVPPRNNRKDKNVIFSDGIRPGCDLAELDDSWDDRVDFGSSTVGSGSNRRTGSKRVQTPSGSPSHQNSSSSSSGTNQRSKLLTSKFGESGCFLPDGPNELPPIYTKNLTESELIEVTNNAQLINRLKTETLQFALQRNLYVYVKIVKLKCCVNKAVINFTTRGMHHVGQDEIVILLEYDENPTDANDQEIKLIPKDIFIHLNQIYREAYKGRAIGDLGFSIPNVSIFLGSSDHGGFLYIRPTFQCLLELQLPDAPFLIGILIHRWEIPWARVFPLRLMLRLGAQYRYYPSPHVSVANRQPVYAEIAQTIINFLADFRNYSYTLATIRGMYIYMEDRKTSVFIPRNRYDQIVKTLNNSSDHILALGGNFSKKADGHLVCIQNMETDCPEKHTYSTQAINIQGQPRKVTGASFLVLNGALKSTSGLSGKCSIVEDGLMVQILPTKMTQIRTALQNKEDIEIICGPIDADEPQTEIVSILWTDNDVEFNIGVKSPIDGKKMDGFPSIRVHSGLNYSNASHTIRWTEVFIIQSDNDAVMSSLGEKDTSEISSIAEQIAKKTSTALVSFLDLLVASGCVKIGLRTTLHQDNVCYETGSNNVKLPPLYMNALDNELIPTLHRQASNLSGTLEKPLILELIFHILDK